MSQAHTHSGDSSAENLRIDASAIVAAVWSRRWRIVLLTVLLLAATYGALIFVPKSYESSASILVEPRDSSFLRATNDGVGVSSITDDTAIASQMELVQSRDTLLQVIDAQNLLDVPELSSSSAGPVASLMSLLGRKQAVPDVREVVVARLAKGLSVVRERQSQIFSIVFTAENPVLAARVANAIAEAHVSRRAGLYIEDTADATKWLSVEIEKLRTRVLDAEEKVANFRVDNDLYVGSNNTSLIDQQLSDIATQITQSRERKSTAVSRATVLNQLIKAGQPIDSVPAVRDSSTIQQLAQEKARLQGERALKLSTQLPNHPDIRALAAQINELDKQILLEGRRIADALDAEARVEGEIEQSLRDELTRAKLAASGATRSTVTLNELEREAKAQRDLLETYLFRYRDASSRTETNSALPDVRIVSFAAPAVSPSSPKTTLILIAALVVSIAGQIGYILFGELISGRVLVETDAVVAGAGVHRYPALGENEPFASEPGQHVLNDEPDFVPEPGDPDLADEFQSSAWEPQREAPDEAVDIVFVDAQRDEADAPEEYSPKAWDGTIQDNSADAFDEQLGDAPASSLLGDDGYAVPASQSVTAEPPDAPGTGQEESFGIIYLASLGSRGDTDAATERLIADALSRGLKVAEVDASGNAPSAEKGLSDLVTGNAGFGDIVLRSHEGRVARVPYGRQGKIFKRSPSAITLVHALADLFDLVIVSVGRPGPASGLPVFAGARGAVVVLSPHGMDDVEVEELTAHAKGFGFSAVEVMPLADADQRVA